MTNEEIATIISCPKTVQKADRKSMQSNNRSLRNNLTVFSDDEQYQFRVFLRQSEEFLEDFSVGLIWTNANEFLQTKKDVILLRCQGPHDSKEPLSVDAHHDYHTHEMTEDDLTAKRYQKPSCHGPIAKFGSFVEAIEYFAKRCNISNMDKFVNFYDDDGQVRGQLSLL